MDIKKIAAGVGLVGYGALWGWAITADKYDRAVDALSGRVDVLGDRLKWTRDQLQIEGLERLKLEERFADQLKGDGDILETGTIEAVADDEEEEEYSEEKTEEIRSNLQGIIDHYTGNPEQRDQFVNVATEATTDRTPPFVITMEKFAWDEEEGHEYDKITLTYYPKHRTLLDDEEDPVEDVANLVGWKNLNQFGGVSGDPEVVYIRNRRLRTDFEVVRDTENDLPLHVKYGMPREEFRVSRAAGVLKLRPEDRD